MTRDNPNEMSSWYSYVFWWLSFFILKEVDRSNENKYLKQEKLQSALIEKGYTQRAFSRKIDLSESYLNQIINSKKRPSPAVANKIISELGIQFNEVFKISNN